MSYVICHMSYVICHMSYVTCHMSYVICICHMSYVIWHVICHVVVVQAVVATAPLMSAAQEEEAHGAVVTHGITNANAGTRHTLCNHRPGLRELKGKPGPQLVLVTPSPIELYWTCIGLESPPK